jgi:hypothetical protein
VGLEAGKFKSGNGGRTSGDEAMTKHSKVIPGEQPEPKHTCKSLS